MLVMIIEASKNSNMDPLNFSKKVKFNMFYLEIFFKIVILSLTKIYAKILGENYDKKTYIERNS